MTLALKAGYVNGQNVLRPGTCLGLCFRGQCPTTHPEPRRTTVWDDVQRESGPAGVDGGCPLCGAVTGLVEGEVGPRRLPPDHQKSGSEEGRGQGLLSLHLTFRLRVQKVPGAGG